MTAFTEEQISRLRQIVIEARFENFVRLHRTKYAPLDVIASNTRFCEESWKTGTVYAGASLKTTLAETLIRVPRHSILEDEILVRSVSEISSTGPLPLIDLTGQNSVRGGVNVNVFNNTNQVSGRLFARNLRQQLPDIAGILYPSRLMDGQINVAIFGAYVGSLTASKPLALQSLEALYKALEEMDISISKAV